MPLYLPCAENVKNSVELAPPLGHALLLKPSPGPQKVAAKPYTGQHAQSSTIRAWFSKAFIHLYALARRLVHTDPPRFDDPEPASKCVLLNR